MKICFFAHNLDPYNGGGVYASHLIEGLQGSLPSDICVFTSEPSTKTYARNVLRKFAFVRNFFKIRREAACYDIVHALDLYPYALLAWLASIGLRKPLVITLIGSGSIIPLYRWVWGPLSRFVLKRAKVVTAISTFVRDEVQKRAPKTTIEVITPGIDLTFWNAAPQKPVHDIRLPARFIVSVGSLRRRKGYRFSLEAFAEVRKRFPDLEYVIVGKRYTDLYMERIAGVLERLGIKDKVHIRDSIETREELKWIYSKAEAFILLSQNDLHDVEGFGMVFLEAASQGLPLVGSRGCGVDDAVEEGKNAFLVGSKDSTAAADALSKILCDPELRLRMSVHSRTFAQRFDWQAKTDELIKLYKKTPIRTVTNTDQ